MQRSRAIIAAGGLLAGGLLAIFNISPVGATTGPEGETDSTTTTVEEETTTTVAEETTTTTAAPGQECHASYEPCVPIAEDVDCAGGDGDGPEYVEGVVHVVDGADDEYGLDRDGNGIGCEGTDPAPAPPPAPPVAAPAQPVVDSPTYTG